MDTLFQQIHQSLEEEHKSKELIKDQVRELEQLLRQLQSTTGQIHSKVGVFDKVAKELKEASVSFKNIFAELQKLVPMEQYYRFYTMWKNAMQQVVFILGLMKWLEDGTLISASEIESILGLPGKSSGAAAWAVELEDYLTGITFLPSELSRLCMNAVISEDYATPKRVQIFVAELYDAFRLINCKNDFLRKRVDGLKYELKKIEEIEYDIQIRKLRPASSS